LAEVVEVRKNGKGLLAFGFWLLSFFILVFIGSLHSFSLVRLRNGVLLVYILTLYFNFNRKTKEKKISNFFVPFSLLFLFFFLSASLSLSSSAMISKDGMEEEDKLWFLC